MYALPLHDALPISSWNGQLHSFTTTVPDSSEYSISGIKPSSESRSASLCSCSSLSSSTSPKFRSAFESRSSQNVWKNSSIVDSSDRKSTRLNSSHVASSYTDFCLKKKIRHERT